MLAVYEFCQTRKIKLIVLFAPLFSETRKALDLPSYEHVYERWKLFFEQKKITYFDCRSSMEDHYFRDGQHLSYHGAKIFTPLILEKIKSN